MYAITGGGSSPFPPLWRGRVIYTVAALEEPYPDRELPQGMKPTLQNLANARRGSSLPRDFLAGHPGSVRERSRSRSPPPFPGRIPLWRPRRVCFLTCPLSSSQTIRPTPSAPGHVAIKDSAHRPVVQESLRPSTSNAWRPFSAATSRRHGPSLVYIAVGTTWPWRRTCRSYFYLFRLPSSRHARPPVSDEAQGPARREGWDGTSPTKSIP